MLLSLFQLPEVLFKASRAVMQIFSTWQFLLNLIFIARNGKERNLVVDRSCGTNNMHSVVRWGSFSTKMLEGKKRIESSRDFKVNSSLKNCTFFKSYTTTPDRNFSGTLKYRREVTEIP